MSVTHDTVMYDVADCKVYSLLTDTIGGSPTYSSAVDVPGIAAVTMNPNFVTAELKGDATIIAKKGRVDKFTVSATYGKLALDVLQIIYGGVVTDGASDAKWRLNAANSLPYFKFAFSIDDTDAGSLQIVLYKCQITGGGLVNPQSDQFGQPTMDLEAIKIDGTIGSDVNPILDVDLFSTVTALG